MKSLLRSWGDSLKLLLPRNLKEWALISFKGTIETYKILLRHFWWLAVFTIGTCGTILYWYRPVPFYALSGMAELLYYIFILLIALWLYACIVAARPSVHLKDASYFVNYYKKIGWVVGSALLFGFLFLALAALILAGVSYVAYTLNLFRPATHCCGCYFLGALLIGAFFIFTLLLIPTFFGLSGFCALAYDIRWWALAGIATLLHVMFSPIFVFCILFLLDAPSSIANVFKSISKGIKLAWYTYPITLLMFILFQAIGWGFLFIYPFRFSLLVGAFLFPVYINIFMYLYVKQIHEQPERYRM